MQNVKEEPRTQTEWDELAMEPSRSAMNRQEIRRTAEVVGSGYSSEALAAAGAVVLTILGLSNVLTMYLAPIAVLAISAAMIMKAMGIAARFHKLSIETGHTIGAESELGTGMSTELLAGAGGIALGILALIGLMPVELMACAVIAFGGAMLMGGGETHRINRLQGMPEHSFAAREARALGKSAAGAETLVGIAAVVLGILALTVAQPLILVLVGLLSIAGTQLMTGLVESGRLAMLIRS